MGMAESYDPEAVYIDYTVRKVLEGSFNCLERKLYIQKSQMKLFASMGAKVKGIHVLYWPPIIKGILKIRGRANRPRKILAGYMDEARGEHWNRKSRYGEK